MVAPNTVTSALLLIAGLLTAFGVHAGLYVLVLPVIAALPGVLLTKIAE